MTNVMLDILDGFLRLSYDVLAFKSVFLQVTLNFELA